MGHDKEFYRTALKSLPEMWTKSLATVEIARDAEPWNYRSWSPKVIRCCANCRGIYDFLLALNSYITSIFNRPRDITPSLHIYTPPLFQVELGRALVSGCPEDWTIQPKRYIRTSVHPIITMNARPRQTDRWTNIMA